MGLGGELARVGVGDRKERGPLRSKHSSALSSLPQKKGGADG